eukprot:133921_1
MAESKDDKEEIFTSANEYIAIVDKGKTAISNCNGEGLCNVYGNVKIQIKKKCIYKWRLLINQRHGAMFIGIKSDKDITAGFQNINYGYEFKSKLGKKYNLGKPQIYGKKCRKGDTIEMIIDTIKKDISYTVNGETQGVAFTNIDDKPIYYLVVCMKVSRENSITIKHFSCQSIEEEKEYDQIENHSDSLLKQNASIVQTENTNKTEPYGLD